jgi:hypothetical protein
MENAPLGTDFRGSPAPSHGRSAGPRAILAVVYVLAVATLAAFGFVTGSTSAILAAAASTLPSGLLAVAGYYLTYGILGLVPGANPSTSTGSASCTPDRVCQESSTGNLAPWFEHTTDAIGVIALTLAAVVNLALLRRVTSERRAPKS